MTILLIGQITKLVVFLPKGLFCFSKKYGYFCYPRPCAPLRQILNSPSGFQKTQAELKKTGIRNIPYNPQYGTIVCFILVPERGAGIANYGSRLRSSAPGGRTKNKAVPLSLAGLAW